MSHRIALSGKVIISETEVTRSMYYRGMRHDVHITRTRAMVTSNPLMTMVATHRSHFASRTFGFGTSDTRTPRFYRDYPDKGTMYFESHDEEPDVNLARAYADMIPARTDAVPF
jgi:hypothetical protein